VQEYISVKVITLKELFSGTYSFRLPFFQRAYAWQTAEVGRLLANITEAMNSAAEPRHYFLGKLMLAQKPGNADTALVDGHQRVMSLTILFAVLRDLAEAGEEKSRLHAFISGSEYRLNPQENLAEFCSRYVQAPGATEVEPEEDLEELCETERNIIENRNYLKGELSAQEVTPTTRRALADFLAQSCYVIVSSVHEEAEAWRILRIEEETRVGFNETDRAKATLLSIVANDDRAACQRAWEKCEAELGFTDMYALLGHLRTMKLRKRSEKPVEIDIAEGFKLNVAGAGRAFVEKELLPSAQRLAAIRSAEIADGAKRKAIARSIDRLGWIHPHLWVPAALLWLSRRGEDASTALFFSRLERLIWIMRIAGLDPTKQQVRILQLLGEIDRAVKVEDMRELEIGKTMREAALSNLRSKTFDSKHYAGKVLRRVSDAIGQDPGAIHPEKVTIEHILPRAWPLNDGWRKRFPTKKSVQTYAHKLGNLTLLTGAENHAADTLDWSEKRPILAGSRLVLANRLAATVDWTPDSIMNRTEDMIRILFVAWDLQL
jgi:hypothetical protein